MKYQLVLQWPASFIKNYDAMTEIEDALAEKLSEVHDIDGHDAGSGEVNIFITTEDPEHAFNEVKPVLDTHDLWTNVRIAYREISGSKYTVLWPRDLTEFKVV